MEEMSLEMGLIPKGYMLVPWVSWDQWNFVRESLFSTSPDLVAVGLRRITTWRSRGCLPVAVEVTASMVEIQQKDPFFRNGLNVDTIASQDMLMMLYSMAITRFVNRLVEKTNGFDKIKIKNAPQTKRQSILDIAVSIGIPRMLVDIRHESSHDELPSLPLLRHAIVKAIYWLQSHYWEPQRRMIPDIKKEIKRRLYQMAYYVKAKHDDKGKSPQIKGRRRKQPVVNVCNKLSSQMTQKLLSSKRDGFEKPISKNSKVIAELYSMFPKEVVSLLLEMYMSQPPGAVASIEINHIRDGSTPTMGHFNAFKEIVMELSSKKPELLLTILKEALRMIEARETSDNGGDWFLQSSENHANICQIKHLSSLVSELVVKLKKMKISNQIGFTDDPQNFSELTNLVPRISLIEVLCNCLHLSASGNKQLFDSAMFLADMAADKDLVEKLRKLPSASLKGLECSLQDFTCQNMEHFLTEEENYLNQAANELETLKSRLKKTAVKVPAADGRNTRTRRRWTLTKSWTPCPIGTLPCPSLWNQPSLEPENNVPDKKETAMIENGGKMDTALGKRDGRCESDDPSEATTSPPKKLREMRNTDHKGLAHHTPSVEGMLLIGGVWRKVGEEEILSIESNIKIMV